VFQTSILIYSAVRYHISGTGSRLKDRIQVFQEKKLENLKIKRFIGFSLSMTFGFSSQKPPNTKSLCVGAFRAEIKKLII
jgi:hypothetical protein